MMRQHYVYVVTGPNGMDECEDDTRKRVHMLTHEEQVRDKLDES